MGEVPTPHHSRPARTATAACATSMISQHCGPLVHAQQRLQRQSQDDQYCLAAARGQLDLDKAWHGLPRPHHPPTLSSEIQGLWAAAADDQASQMSLAMEDPPLGSSPAECCQTWYRDDTNAGTHGLVGLHDGISFLRIRSRSPSRSPSCSPPRSLPAAPGSHDNTFRSGSDTDSDTGSDTGSDHSRSPSPSPPSSPPTNRGIATCVVC